ncbi:MAG TPA: hypothetical protein VE912_14055, partial [Bacteroidales bacterium]|nr:hypothetical protein [Bacteroidales bacterium]
MFTPKHQYIIVAIIVMTTFAGCQKSIEFWDLKENFQLIHTYKIADSLFSDSPISVTLDNKFNLYYSDLYKREIVETDSNFTHFTIVSNRGLGPYEYSTPSHLFVQKNYLYYSDSNNGLIKRIPLDWNVPHRAIQIPGMTGSRIFAVLDNLLLASSEGPNYFLKAFNLHQKSGAILNAFKKFPLKKGEKYGNKFNINGGDILADPVDRLFYFAPTNPSHIIVIDKNLKIQNNIDLHGIKEILNSKNGNNKSKLSNLLVTRKLCLFHARENVLLLHVFEAGSGKQYYFLINTDGHIIKTFVSKKRSLLCSREKIVY